MSPAYFDHIEVHVEDIPRYCEFLVQMFCGGHYQVISELKIDQTLQNLDGPCYFFTDHEGLVWHIKDYLVRNKFVNW